MKEKAPKHSVHALGGQLQTANQKTCTRASCSELVSFEEETCFHVVLTGLVNDDLKEKAITQATPGVVTNLNSLVNFATVEEASRHRNPLKEIAAISKNTQQENCLQRHLLVIRLKKTCQL